MREPWIKNGEKLQSSHRKVQMSFEISDLKLRSSKDLIDPHSNSAGVMEGTVRKTSTVENKSRDYKTLVQANSRKSSRLSYFSIKSLLVLFCLTASLLLLPLILPPLPPPPSMLLLVPIAILLVLVVLVLVPSDVRGITSSCGWAGCNITSSFHFINDSSFFPPLARSYFPFSQY